MGCRVDEADCEFAHFFEDGVHGSVIGDGSGEEVILLMRQSMGDGLAALFAGETVVRTTTFGFSIAADGEVASKGASRGDPANAGDLPLESSVSGLEILGHEKSMEKSWLKASFLISFSIITVNNRTCKLFLHPHPPSSRPSVTVSAAKVWNKPFSFSVLPFIPNRFNPRPIPRAPSGGSACLRLG